MKLQEVNNFNLKEFFIATREHLKASYNIKIANAYGIIYTNQMRLKQIYSNNYFKLYTTTTNLEVQASAMA